MADETTTTTDTTAGQVASELEALKAGREAEKYATDQATEAQNKYNDSAKKTSEVIGDVADAQDNVANATNFANKALEASTHHLSEISDIGKMASDKFKEFENILSNSGETIEAFNNRGESAKDAFSMISAAAFSSIGGIKESFNGLGSIDMGSVSLMSDEINGDDFLAKATNAAGVVTAAGANSFKDLAKRMFPKGTKEEIDGTFSALMASAKKGKTAFGAFFKSLTSGVDNVRRLTNAQIQFSAATGMLDELYENSGPGLKNINSLLLKQVDEIGNLSKAYNVNDKDLEQYWATMGKIPGALSSQVKGYDDSVGNVTALHGALLLAKGSGRSFTDVADDMYKAVRFGAKDLDTSIDFTTRISEITNNYGLELKDVRQHLINLGDGFRFFGDQSKGATLLVNEYVGAIKQTGVSGNVALEIVGQMAGGVQKLTLAQKAFLSSQTGGAGGLMGAFEIEKELRDGNMNEVFGKVRDTMKKQMGEIVSLEEASSSREAAARLTKQIQILRSGPLGQFADSDQSAIRILEGFKSLESGDSIVKDLGGGEQSTRDVLMSKGNELLQRNNDLLGGLNRSATHTSNVASFSMFDTMQRALGNTDSDKVSDLQLRASKVGEKYTDEVSGDKIQDDFAKISGESVGGVVDAVRGIGGSLDNIKDIASNITKEFFTKKDDTDEQKVSDVNVLSTAAKESGLSGTNLKTLAAGARSGDEAAKKTLSTLAAGTAIKPMKPMNQDIQSLKVPNQFSSNNALSFNNGEMVKINLPQIDPKNKKLNDLGAGDVMRAANINSENKEEVVGNVASKTSPETGQIEILSKVEVHGICIDCGKKSHSDHFQTTGVSNNKRN